MKTNGKRHYCVVYFMDDGRVELDPDRTMTHRQAKIVANGLEGHKQAMFWREIRVMETEVAEVLASLDGDDGR